MNRRSFVQVVSAASALSLGSLINQDAWAQAVAGGLQSQSGSYGNLLILIELKGANDGLNTVVPYTQPNYAKLRPSIGLKRDSLLQLTDKEALHPSLAALMPLWEAKELAVIQGLGYPNPNLSHFRSIEIWDTASKSEEYLESGWLSRTFAQAPTPRSYAADGVVVGSNDMGPLSGLGTRTIALADTNQFLRTARLAKPSGDDRNAALRHILSVESEIVHAASRLNTQYVFKTEFKSSAFGAQVRTAAQLAASKAGMAVIRLSLGGFDTHANQLATHANLLKELAEGIGTLKAALLELGLWDKTLVMTYAEFGRRPKENQSSGTDHGTANVHFVAGGRVSGGMLGDAPLLGRLDGNGNLPFSVDFRSVYATVIDQWWGGSSKAILRGSFAPLPLLKA